MKNILSSRSFSVAISLVLTLLLVVNLVFPSSSALSSDVKTEEASSVCTESTASAEEKEADKPATTDSMDTEKTGDSLPLLEDAEANSMPSSHAVESADSVIQAQSGQPVASSAHEGSSSDGNGAVLTSAQTTSEGVPSGSFSQESASKSFSAQQQESSDPYQEKIDTILAKLSKAEHDIKKKLCKVLLDAFDEYMELPVEERSLLKKIHICLSKTGELTQLQTQSDKEVDELVRELEEVLKEAGRDDSLAVEVREHYSKEKSQLYSDLWNAVYHGGDGSGSGGAWLEQYYLALGD